ncbi:hypothetical protein AWR38_14555 [Idiomarina sp. WRN-38]|nr:hypothetical protein AUR68_14540 [Idiomarina sp. H105]MBE92211.1 hypothetical protein [Idiomarina sp.]OAF04599.1 hypothetical protein AWR38_14555 [Idiomarina sp. WRN-38]
MTKLSDDQKSLLTYLRNGKPLHICIDLVPHMGSVIVLDDLPSCDQEALVFLKGRGLIETEARKIHGINFLLVSATEGVSPC